MATETNFRNIRYTLSDTAILSQSTWDYGTVRKFSVAIFRKVGKSWKLDMNSVIEGGVHAKRDSKAAVEEARSARDYKMIDISKPMIEAEMGEYPTRFYRDNVRGQR